MLTSLTVDISLTITLFISFCIGWQNFGFCIVGVVILIFGFHPTYDAGQLERWVEPSFYYYLKKLDHEVTSVCKRRIRDPVIGLLPPVEASREPPPTPTKAQDSYHCGFLYSANVTAASLSMKLFEFHLFIYFHVFRYRRTFTCFSGFQEAILGQNYCGEDSHTSVSITISSNFSSLIHLSVFSILSIFSSPEHIVF